VSERRGVLQTLAATLVSLGGGVLIWRATGWSDPVLWIGIIALTTGASIFLWLLVPSWLTDRRARQERTAALLLEGRAISAQAWTRLRTSWDRFLASSKVNCVGISVDHSFPTPLGERINISLLALLGNLLMMPTPRHTNWMRKRATLATSSSTRTKLRSARA
jgi:hypothetical protein